MASFVLRPNGVYYVVASTHGLRTWRSTGARTRHEAEAVARKRFPEFFVSHRKTTSALRQFFTQYLEYARTNLAPTTVLLYEGSFRSFTRLLGEKPLQDYTVHDIERFKILRSKEVSLVKVNIDCRCIKSMFQTAVRWDLIAKSPFAGVRLLRIPPRRPIFFTRKEIQVLLDSIPIEWFKEIILFAISTMMRLGEIVYLDWNSVDLQRKFIMVENTLDHRLKTTQPHAVPMNDWVFNYLASRPSKSGRVFKFPEGRNLNAHYVSKKFSQYARRAGFPRGYHFHTLRHTGATWLVQDGVSIYAVQKLLGHSNIQVTMMYSHLMTAEMQESVNRLLLPAPAPKQQPVLLPERLN